MLRGLAESSGVPGEGNSSLCKGGISSSLRPWGFGINYDDNEQGSYIQVPIAQGKIHPPQTSKRSTEGEVILHPYGGAIRKLDGDSRP
jgi:hypothetical protein